MKASDIFNKAELEYIKKIIKMFKGTVVEIILDIKSNGFSKFKK